MDVTDDRLRGEIEELVSVDGGQMTFERLGSSMRNEDLVHAWTSLEAIAGALNEVSAANAGPRVWGVVTASPAMGATVRAVGSNHAVLLVPIGTIARLQVMHRLLLSHWNRDGRPLLLVQSLMDRPHERPIAPQLAPLLRDAVDERDWWDALDELDATTVLDPAFAPDVSELNHLALSILLSHEFAHIARHHHEVTQRVRSGELSFMLGDGDTSRPGTDRELRRAIENDADMVGAYLVTLALVRDADPASLTRGFVRLGYALTAVFALFDPHRLSIMEYDKDAAYPHPAVRHAAAMDDIRTVAAQVGALDDYEQGAEFGFDKCLDALRWIETDIFVDRRYGATGVVQEAIVHALRTSRASMTTVAHEQGQQRTLALRLGTLIAEQYGGFSFAPRSGIAAVSGPNERRPGHP